MKTCLIILISIFLICGNCPAQEFEMKEQQQPLAGIQGKPGSGKISLDIKGMDITDVLKMLAQRGGMNIVAGKNVRGKVTIFLKDVDIMDALEIILISNELAYDKKGEIINVMTDRDYEALYGEKFHDKTALKVIKLKYGKASEVSKALNQIKSRVGKIVTDDISNTLVVMDSPQLISRMEQLAKEMDLPTQTRVFALNYSKAETMKAKLEPLLTKGVGTIQIDERTNKVIITDLENNIGAIATAVTEFDEKTKEVLIDAKILQITLNNEYRMGINWDAIFSAIKSQMGMNFNIITGNVIPTTGENAVTGGAVHIGGLDTKFKAEAMIKFLESYGKTNLLASPRIVAVNNEEAKILVGTNQPYATSQTTTPATGAATTAYSVTFLDLGVKLYVTPTINRDGFITMKIKPEVSSTSSNYSYGANEDKVPIVSTSQAETTVMVKDGTTLVIAGLIENREEEETKKVPGLGDVPFLGGMFRSRTRGSTTNPEKNELVIFLTPHIISGDGESPEVDKYAGITDKLESQLTQKEIREVSRKLQKEMEDEEGVSSEKTAQEKAREKITLPAEPKPGEYYETVRKMILSKVRENYPGQPVKGEVYLSFCIAKDGSLKGAPSLLRPVNDALAQAAVAAVKAAAPFPPLPKNVVKKQETFKISIIYE